MADKNVLCPIFGQCGGCKYQDLDYKEELRVKESYLKQLFDEAFPKNNFNYLPIVGSPKDYHYRNRLDLKLLREKDKGIKIGFTPIGEGKIIEIDQCPIALEAISDFIPTLKVQAIEKLPDKYRMANLVVRTGDEGDVYWGGIGKRSLRLDEEKYFYSQVNNKKIFYSLDTFFQANLSILPRLMDDITQLSCINSDTLFYDLYGGVGLFGLCVADKVKKVYLIEENPASITLAQYNVVQNKLKNFSVIEGRVEDKLSEIIEENLNNAVAMIDPPRAGLSEDIIQFLVVQPFKRIIYLSCHPESLVRDLKVFLDNDWNIEQIIPYDFFPKTKHIETLVLLNSPVIS